MLENTKDAIRSVCKIDPTITEEQVDAALAELEGRNTKETQAKELFHVFTREQVAELLGVTCKTVTSYAKRGLLVPLYMGVGGMRARAYTSESVKALLSGRFNMVAR